MLIYISFVFCTYKCIMIEFCILINRESSYIVILCCRFLAIGFTSRFLILHLQIIFKRLNRRISVRGSSNLKHSVFCVAKYLQQYTVQDLDA